MTRILLLVTALCALTSVWASNGNGNGNGGGGGHPQDLFVVESANRNPVAGFCATFAAPAGGAAIEIIQQPSVADPNWQAYLGIGPVIPTLFPSWPNVLPFNPAVPAIGPLVKNTEDARRLMVNGSCLYRSPGIPDAVALATPALSRKIVTYYPPAPYTPPPSAIPAMRWNHIASLVCFFQYPEHTTVISPSAAPPAGSMFAWMSDSCLVFQFLSGNEVVVMTDEWGNTYIMVSTNGVNQGPADLINVVLPTGWSLERKTLTEDLILWPTRWNMADGTLSNTCSRINIRDNMFNGYQQITFGTRGAFFTHGQGRNHELFSVLGFQPTCVTRLVEQGLLSTDHPDSSSSSSSSSGSEENTRRLRHA